MTPAAIAAIIALVEEAIVQAPTLINEFKDVFSKPNPTPADWLAIRTRVLSQDYATLVPDSQIPAGQ